MTSTRLIKHLEKDEQEIELVVPVCFPEHFLRGRAHAEISLFVRLHESKRDGSSLIAEVTIRDEGGEVIESSHSSWAASSLTSAKRRDGGLSARQLRWIESQGGEKDCPVCQQLARLHERES